ncbi:hypothetical protein, partial [Bradyrhizobium sp.]|uniref:hypothetical protein n=1 Tax=Bradyrhizobium sp. TaxID=376 RepID=UPI0025B99C79
LNSVAPPATILNDVPTFSVGGAFLNLHCLFAYNAAQETYQRAFIVVQMISPRHSVQASFPLRFQPQLSKMKIGNLSAYFDITGGRDHRNIVPHFHEAHVDQDPKVIRADRHYFSAVALYVLQRPAEANSVLELLTGKACLWFCHLRIQSDHGRIVGSIGYYPEEGSKVRI